MQHKTQQQTMALTVANDYVALTFFLVKKSYKKDTAPEKWRKMNVWDENEIVTTIEYGRANGDVCAKNKANLQNMDFIFYAPNIHFLIAIFRMPVITEQVRITRLRFRG